MQSIKGKNIMQIKTQLDFEQEHFDNAILHDLKAAVAVIKRHGLEKEFYVERLHGGDLRESTMPKAEVKHES